MSDGCSYITGDTISIDGGHASGGAEHVRGAFKNFRRKTGNGRGRHFRLPRARKKKAGRPEINKPESPGRDAMIWQSLTRASNARSTVASRIFRSHQPTRQSDRQRVLSAIQPLHGGIERARRCAIGADLARGRLFSVVAIWRHWVACDALPVTIKSWTADLHAAIVRMVRMRAPVVRGGARQCGGGSVSLMARAIWW